MAITSHITEEEIKEDARRVAAYCMTLRELPQFNLMIDEETWTGQDPGNPMNAPEDPVSGWAFGQGRKIGSPILLGLILDQNIRSLATYAEEVLKHVDFSNFGDAEFLHKSEYFEQYHREFSKLGFQHHPDPICRRSRQWLFRWTQEHAEIDAVTALLSQLFMLAAYVRYMHRDMKSSNRRLFCGLPEFAVIVDNDIVALRVLCRVITDTPEEDAAKVRRRREELRKQAEGGTILP